MASRGEHPAPDPHHMVGTEASPHVPLQLASGKRWPKLVLGLSTSIDKLHVLFFCKKKKTKTTCLGP